MLTELFGWALCFPTVLFFILGGLALLLGIYALIKYRDGEIILCFVLAAIMLMFLGFFFGIGKAQEEDFQPSIEDSVHIIGDDTNTKIIFSDWESE